MDNLVELRGFGWRHAGRAAWAVRDIDLTIEAGERVLLLGPSGAGKSTLLAGLAGLLPTDSGEQRGTVRVAGVPARDARSLVATVFQDPGSQIVMSRAGDDVAFGLVNRAVPADQVWPRVDAALDSVGFGYGRDHPTHALSGGELQRLALAGALAIRPRLLLLDEPTANLDARGAELVRRTVKNVLAATGAALVLVEHRVAEILPMVSRVVALGPDGRLLADGPPDVVFGTHAAALTEAGVWLPDSSAPPDGPLSAGRAPTDRTERSAGEVVLRGAGLAFRHPGASGEVILAGECRVEAGRILALTGPNGTGKSTLALLLGGLIRPARGVVAAAPALADGLTPDPSRWRAAQLAQRIGSVFQNPEHQFVTARVADELALGPRRAGVAADRVSSIVDDLLERLRLGKLASANPFTLSGGEQRRLSVATAFATDPRVLVLDEPTFGQDRRTWGELVRLLDEARGDGRAIVAATHDELFVAATADRVQHLPRCA